MTQELAKARAKEVAFVTGGASGIGRATVARLARDGFHVVVIDRNAGAARASSRRELHRPAAARISVPSPV